MPRRPRRLPIACTCLLAYVLFAGGAGVYLAEGVVRPARIPLTPADREAAARLSRARAARLDNLEIVSRGGLRLRAWLFTPAVSNRPSAANAPSAANLPASAVPSVIVLHGQGSNRAGMLAYIDLLLSEGLQVLAPDARAHGESEGAIATYGVAESADVRRWIDLLRTRSAGQCVYGFAESMGAGTLLQALDASPELCGAVAESPFASFREVAYDRLATAFHTPPWIARTALRPIVDAGFLYVRARYDVDLDQAAPLATIARSSVPLLLIHGAADSSIPPRHSRLLEAARPGGTRLWVVPGADHCGAIGVAPDEFRRHVLAIFGGHLAPAGR